jgi:hypothetical protein
VEVCGISTTKHELCARCGEAPPADDDVLCGHCFWQIRAEVEEGMYELRAYLVHWLEFREWEEGAR